MTSEDMGFWLGREPCWVMTDCSSIIHKKCPAYLDRSQPCWDHRRTACAEVFPQFRNCEGCKVFRRYSSAAKLKQPW